MSKNAGGALGKVRGDQTADSVFDFLYHDVRRIGSFLAQFDVSGHLQQVRQTETAETGASHNIRGTVKGSVAVLAGEVVGESQTREGSGETSQRVYDPLWTNARTFLDYLSERNMIHRDPTRARIGQFVLSTGRLAILDLKMLKEVWELPVVRKMFRAGGGASQLPRQQRRAIEHGKGPDTHTQEPNPAELASEMLPILPHTIQAYLEGDGLRLWFSLREEGLIGSSSDLLLKHGVEVQGEWTVLGILDALPDDAPVSAKPTDDDAPLRWGLMGKLLESLAPITRGFLGRPSEAYGLTPLLLFRSVSG